MADDYITSLLMGGQLPAFDTGQGANTPIPQVNHSMGPVPMPKGETLGKIGDFFSWLTGGKQQYKESVRRAEAANALDGFVDDPLAAIQRLSRVDPGAAIDLYNNYTKNSGMADYRQAQIDLKNAAAEQRAAEAQMKAKTYVGALLRTIKDGRSLEYARPIIQKQIDRYGLDDLSLPGVYDEDQMNVLRNYGLTGNQDLISDDKAAGREQSDINNLRSTGTSRENNIRSTNTSMRNTDVREAGVTARQGTAEAGKDRRQAKAEAGKDRRKGPPGADYKKYEYRQKPDGTWQRRPKQ